MATGFRQIFFMKLFRGWRISLHRMLWAKWDAPDEPFLTYTKGYGFRIICKGYDLSLWRSIHCENSIFEFMAVHRTSIFGFVKTK